MSGGIYGACVLKVAYMSFILSLWSLCLFSVYWQMFELVGQKKEGRPSQRRDVNYEGHSGIQRKLISRAN